MQQYQHARLHIFQQVITYFRLTGYLFHTATLSKQQKLQPFCNQNNLEGQQSIFVQVLFNSASEKALVQFRKSTYCLPLTLIFSIFIYTNIVLANSCGYTFTVAFRDDFQLNTQVEIAWTKNARFHEKPSSRKYSSKARSSREHL